MKYILLFFILCYTASIVAQTTLYPDDLVIELDSLPGDIDDTQGAKGFLFYNGNKNALRGGMVILDGEGASFKPEDRPYKSLSTVPFYDEDQLGLGSIAYGINVAATSFNSVAFGYNSSAQRQGAVAMGNESMANGVNSVALSGGRTYGEESFAYGMFSESKGTASWAGGGASAIGDISFAHGSSNCSKAHLSTTFGLSNQTNAFGGFTVGTTNDTLYAPQDSLNNQTALFVIGNGYFEDTLDFENPIFVSNHDKFTTSKTNIPTFGGILHRRNALEVYYDGRTIFKPVDSENTLIVDKIKDTGEYYESVLKPSIADRGYIGTETFPFFRTYSKEVYVDADPANYMTYSDQRLKTNIATLQHAMSLISALHPVSYTNKDDDSQKLIYGLIAQEVEAVIPEIVKTGANDIKAVGYQALIPILIKGMQEQQELIETQAAQIEELQMIIRDK